MRTPITPNSSLQPPNLKGGHHAYCPVYRSGVHRDPAFENLTAICAQRGLALRADALRSDLARPLRPGAAELLHSQFTTLLFYIGNR